MERQLINQGYIIALIALCRLKIERQLIKQGFGQVVRGPQALIPVGKGGGGT